MRLTRQNITIGLALLASGVLAEGYTSDDNIVGNLVSAFTESVATPTTLEESPTLSSLPALKK